LFNVSDHALCGNVIVVNTVVSGVAATLAGRVPVVDPGAAVGVRAGGRCNELLTFVQEVFKVLLPESGAVARIHVGLTGLIGLVETHGNVGIALHNKLLEVADLVGSPQHRHGLEAEGLAVGRELGAPGVEELSVA